MELDGNADLPGNEQQGHPRQPPPPLLSSHSPPLSSQHISSDPRVTEGHHQYYILCRHYLRVSSCRAAGRARGRQPAGSSSPWRCPAPLGLRETSSAPPRPPRRAGGTPAASSWPRGNLSPPWLPPQRAWRGRGGAEEERSRSRCLCRAGAALRGGRARGRGGHCCLLPRPGHAGTLGCSCSSPGRCSGCPWSCAGVCIPPRTGTLAPTSLLVWRGVKSHS